MTRKPCRKVTYPSKGAAFAKRRRVHKDEPLNVYFCKACAGWHLGSSSRSDRVQDRFSQILASPPPLKRPPPGRAHPEFFKKGNPDG